MFIDVKATKLINNRGVTTLLNKIEEGRLGNLDRGSDRASVITALRTAFVEHYAMPNVNVGNINYELDGHIAIGVFRKSAQIKSTNGTFREKFSHHNQLHISNEMAVLSVSQRRHPTTLGLLIPNTEARNPMYFDHAVMFDFLKRRSKHGIEVNRVLILLNTVKILLKKPAPEFNYDDARTCVLFVQYAMGLLKEESIPTIEPKTKLTTPNNLVRYLGSQQYHVLYPYIVKVYLEICKRDGNYALGTHQLWQ